MSLRSFVGEKQWSGKRVLVRVDFNVPLDHTVDPDSFLKVSRSLETIHWLQNKGAVVILLTHLGRPDKFERAFSTERLLPALQEYKLVPTFHPEQITKKTEYTKLLKKLSEAKPGSIHLLENVRFNEGEEENRVSLAKIYASFGEVFINDAFAVCHRKQASVIGVAKQLPSFAGFALQTEIKWLEKILKKPKSPFLVFLGGKKLSTKMPVIKALLPKCDQLFLGGAMATTCLAAQGKVVGASYIEKEQLKTAKTVAKQENVYLPTDVVVSHSVSEMKQRRVALVDDLKEKEIVVDVGPRTLKQWADAIKKAKTILWNGPMGITEIRAFGAGSRGLARFIGEKAKGSALGLAGGGDTLPVIFSAKMQDEFDYLSTGGGALLEYVAHDGRLPGLDVLQ